MKLFVILILFALFLTLLYVRLRPYILMARRMFGVVRDARSINPNEPAQPLRSDAAAGNKLVRCDACGTWIPASRAVKLRSSLATYCSHACLENIATNKRGQKRAV